MVDPELADAFFNKFHVAGITEPQPLYAGQNPCTRTAVPQLRNPVTEGATFDKLNHLVM